MQVSHHGIDIKTNAVFVKRKGIKMNRNLEI